MRVPLLDLKAQYNSIGSKILGAVQEVLQSQHLYWVRMWLPLRKHWRYLSIRS